MGPFESQVESAYQSSSQINESFETWMQAVGHIIQRLAGVSYEDLPDYDYRNWWASGLRPERAAKRAIKLSESFGGIGVDMNHAQFLRHPRTRVVWNWIVKAYNSRGGLGPWMVKDIIEGSRKYNVEGVRGKIDHSDAEEALEVLEKQGVVTLQRIPAGMIETFMIKDLDA